MSNLRRVRSTDLQVLRSILNDEVIVDINENVNPDLNCDDLNQTDESKIDSKKENPLAALKLDNKTYKKAVKKKPNKAHDKPFMVTRIESKHKFTRYNDDDGNQENVPIDDPYKADPSKPAAIYKSIHYKSIVETENRLERKYEELAKMLNREVVEKTVSLCDQSINEARQLIQNSLATSRIVSSFLNDMSQSGRRIPTNFLISNNSWHPPSFEENCEETLNKNIDKNDAWIDMNGNIDRKLGSDHIHNPNIHSFNTTNIFGMSAATTNRDSSDQHGKSSRKAGTDHLLDSDEPFIQQWLASKNQRMKLERRIKREEMKIEQAVSVSALAVQQQRKAAADEAFNRWLSSKKINEVSTTREKYDSAESDSEICLPQAGRQPKPSQKLPTRRMMSLPRPKSVATFNMNPNVKMKVAGHQMSLSISDFKQNSPAKIDYSKYVPKREQIILRPQTAFPQSRGMNATIASKPTQSQRLPRQRRMKRLRNKRKESLLEDNAERNKTNNETEEDNKINDKPNSIYSDQFSISEKEQETLVAISNTAKSIHGSLNHEEHLHKDESISDHNEMSDNISLSSFEFN